MDGKIFVLVIIAMAFMYSYFERRQKAQIKKQFNKQSEVDDKTRAELDDLRQRVETLERIATDKGSRLREEIDAL